MQPGSSSAFDRAAAIATRGATQEIGDIASTLSYQSFNDERNRQFQAQEAARAAENEALASELERRGQFDEAERVRQFQASESAAGRTADAISQYVGSQDQQREAALDRQAAAASALPQVQEQEVNTMISNLGAQALPRLIEQYGYDQALSIFNDSVTNLLSVLGVAAGVTQPTLGYLSESSGTTDGSSGSFQLK